MYIQLGWRVFLNTSDRNKAKRLTNKLFAVLNSKCELTQCEVYWKNPEWHELIFIQFLKNKTPIGILTEILNRLSLLSYHWNLDLVPDFSEKDYTDLSGGTNHGIRISGIISMTFQVLSSKQ